MKYLVDEERVIGIGVDNQQYATYYGKNIGGIDMVCGDARELPLRTGSCDAVLSHNFLSIDYMDNDSIIITLREGHRVLSPGGVFIASLASISSEALLENPFARAVFYHNENWIVDNVVFYKK